jgi:hypothetical protein
MEFDAIEGGGLEDRTRQDVGSNHLATTSQVRRQCMTGPEKRDRRHPYSKAAVERARRGVLQLEIREKLVKLESDHIYGKVSDVEYRSKKAELQERLAEIDP